MQDMYIRLYVIIRWSNRYVWTPYLITVRVYSTLTFDFIVNRRNVSNIILFRIVQYSDLQYYI